MNAILQALLPSLLGLLETPAFQSLLKSILDDMIKKISAGVPPVAVTQQATGLVTAAAALHLTGNPVADIQSLLAGLQPHGTTPVNSAPPAFNS